MSAEFEIKITAAGKKLKKELEKLNNIEVCAGFQRGKATEDDGTDVCDIAAWNEFGTVNIPSRPFIRDAIDNKGGEVAQLLQQEMAALVNGQSTVENLCKKTGLKMKDIIQKSITDGNFAPNAASTIAKKGSSHPLIDTGRMRQSVLYVTREKGSGES